MTEFSKSRDGSGNARLALYLRHLICIIALMWTGLVNGQPFFFSDTTNYIRAADMAAHLASGRTFSTEWTNRYSQALGEGDGQGEGSAEPQAARHNDVGRGMIMAGRSPYIGALMYVGYLTTNFWAFVAFQAAVAYALIVLSLRRFDIDSDTYIIGVVLFLSATTSLPTYNSLLLADAFFAFGILSFILLATPGKLTKGQILFLSLVLITSAVSHVHSLAMIPALLLALAACRWLKWQSAVPRRAWITGIAAIVLGFISIQVTALATEAAVGKKPQFLPVLTARFVADGPGKAFIDAGCEDKRFQICRVHIGEPRIGGAILSGTTRESGTYLLASPDERQRMGAEDTAFALAVFRTYPFWQSAMIVRNTVRQLLWIDYDGLNTGCFESENCWTSLPADVRADLRASLSGQNAWPAAAMNALLYAVVILSLAALVGLWPRLSRTAPESARRLRIWVTLIGIGMLAGAALGGAGVEPQYRYQGRLIWLVPLLGAIIVLLTIRNSPAGRQETPVSIRE